MQPITLVRILEDENSRNIISEILKVFEQHQLSIGHARNILTAAGCALNLAPATIFTELPKSSQLWEDLNSHRLRVAPIVTDTLLRDA